MSDFNKQIIEEFRANHGVVGGYFEGSTIMLLHTTGAKSGLKRVNPLVTLHDGDRYVVVASKGGAPTNPDWYHNIRATPNVTVEVGTEKFEGVATVTDEPERTELYGRMEEHSSGFTEYKNKAGRVIPVVVINRS